MAIWSDKKNIAIWGAGREGMSAYHFLQAKCPSAKFTFVLDEPAELPEPCVSPNDMADFDLLIKSPGVSLYRPEIQSFNGTLGSATNLWFEENLSAKTIVVTGTKGKTTVASMIHHILKEAGIKSVLAGNIGTALLETTPGDNVTVIELSSYQIADLSFGPDVAVFTNLYPEHAPWHGNKEQYFKDKLRLADLDPKTQILASGEDKELHARLQKAEWVERIDSDLPVKGTHNMMNVSLALAAIKAAGFNVDNPAQYLSTFKMPPHRLEEIGTYHGMLCVNDSISTVPQATLAALDSYKDKTLILILGGQDRGQEYAELAEKISDYQVRHVLTLPENHQKIADALDGKVSLTHCGDLKQAVASAFEIGKEGDVLLLSPAAPSYVQFKNFEERGEVFKTLCQAND